MGDRKSTMEQLRSVIGSDGDANSVKKPPPAPAASPLGTDDEAGGTTPTKERIEMARVAEERIQASAGKQRDND